MSHATAATTAVAAPPRALIFMTGRNCERYVAAAIESLVWQTHRDLHVLFVDDASTDGTGEIAREMLDEYFDGRHTRIRNAEPWGKARNAHVHLRAALHEGDFVAVLDADDQLVQADIVAVLAERYSAGFDVVWTNYCTDRDTVGGNGPLNPFESPRGQGWRTSHCFSFRSELLVGVPEDRFQDSTGAWFTAACDFALAYPVLDQTRRYCHLPLQAYRYTTANPSSHHNRDSTSRGLSSTHQMRCAQEVLSKAPLPCRRWLFGDHAAADAAISQLQQFVLPQTPAETTRPLAPAAWEGAAASALANLCPSVLDLALDGSGDALDVASSWRLWRWLASGDTPRRVLEIGAGELAAVLHPMVRSLGGSVTTVSGDPQRAESLRARLRRAGVEGEVLDLPMVDAEFGPVRGSMPDLSSLPDVAKDFDVVVVSASLAGASPDSAMLALPMVALRLSERGFRVLLWAPEDDRLRREARALWHEAAPDLLCTDGACGGSALCVQSMPGP